MDDFVMCQRVPFWGRNVIIANDAIIENINWDRRTSYVTISYGVMDRNRITNIELVTLVVGLDTIIRDSSGRLISARNLREGMVVDAVFSTAMTRSIPPQSRAFSISVVREINDSAFTEGRVIEVDTEFNYFITGNQFDIYSQTRFNVSNSTIIRDRRGRSIRLRDLMPGDFVRVEHANFQTMSIPPQTPAYEVQII